MLKTLILAVGLLLGTEALLAQAQLSDAVKSFVRVDAPLVALEAGTGGIALEKGSQLVSIVSSLASPRPYVT